MTKISFTSALKTFFPDLKEENMTVDSLEALFIELDKRHTGLSGYLVDDKGEIRAHVKIYIDNEPVEFAVLKEMSLANSSQIHIMQAISGG
jgi:hypothetical protein